MTNGIEYPIFQKDLYDLFGEPDEGQWAEDYMQVLDLTQFAADFAHVKDYTGARWKHKIYCNYILHEPLFKAFQNVVDSRLAHELKSFDGCFNIRPMSSGSGLSTHSWGVSVDLNAADNPYRGKAILSDKFVRCFSDVGFEWGGLWRIKDGMHLQFCWTKDWRGSTNPLAPVVWAT